ncbi:helix-turn-helix domain-containing protein [Mycobacteroides abscessus]|uniref:helix-turn-helix domain-containing protein n=1 Tax=Mycobacteroides abscessus TaxID=36809 RepID=UPI0003757C0C|nr:helix-turn-helix transcriptional regulator [Mycobacteroides abscessus]
MSENLGEHSGSINAQFGDRMRECRELRSWSQRQVADLLQAVGIKLDPSAITRIERGTRDVKLSEAIAIADVLGFDLDSIAYSPEERFRMDEWALRQIVIKARRGLLDAIRFTDRMANRTDLETEEGLVEKRGLPDIAALYTDILDRTTALKRGGHMGVDGDNFALYYNDDPDLKVKERIVEVVTRGILISERELDEIQTEKSIQQIKQLNVAEEVRAQLEVKSDVPEA